MATAAEINTDISCIICLNVFTDPRSLPCGHTFCHNCLNEHIKRTVRGSTFLCPFCRAPATVKHSIQQQESFARQFPVNYPLVQTIDLIQKLQIQNTKDQLRTKLKTVHEKLHMTCQMVELKLDQQLDHQLQDLDLSVAQIADNIDNIADKMIKQVTSTVQADQEALHKQLAICHEKARTNTKAKFNQTKTLLATPKHYLASSTHLLNDEAVSKLEIENNMKAIEVEQTTLKDYFDTHEVEGSNKIVFTKADNTTKIAPKVGTLNLTDEPTTTGLPPRRTQQIDRQHGRLKLVKVINTSHRSQTWQPILSSIAVLHVQQLTLILVADNNNHHVKSYNDNGTLHSIYSTYGIPSGLAKFRDNQIVVTLPPQKEILFLEVDETKTFLIKRVKTEKSYYMVTALPDFNLAASFVPKCDTFLDIMDQDCTVLWSAPYNAYTPYDNCCLRPKYITVSDNYFLIISNTSPYLTCITKTGDKKWSGFDAVLAFMHEGITCDNFGFIYIANYYGNSIVQRSPSGKILREIITEEDTSNPKAVCFDHDRLYVTQEDAEIRVFKWE